MEDLRRNSLKYSMLVNRMNGKEIDQIIQGNLKVQKNNKSNDFTQTHVQQYS